MLDTALRILNEITNQGFEAYIVGGFVRDYLLGITTNDVDICTSATPKDIKEIFENITLPRVDYGAVRLNFKNYRFDIMTFRKESEYSNNRQPLEVKYIKDLLIDLQRRDFKMNTVCMDKNGDIIDLIDGKKDIENKIINTVGDSISRFVEDPLRILRAVRFYTTLEFELSDEVKTAILRTKNELRRLSYQRKKDELDNLDNAVLFKYGLYVNVIAGTIKGLDRKEIGEKYNALPIKTRDEVNITSNQIMGVLDMEPSKKIKEIYEDLINNILCGKVENNYEEIVHYLIEKYK